MTLTQRQALERLGRYDVCPEDAAAIRAALEEIDRLTKLAEYFRTSKSGVTIDDVREVLNKHGHGAATFSRLVGVMRAAVETETADLRERLRDYEDERRTILEEKCGADEKHCTCVQKIRAAIAKAEGRE